MGRVGSIVWKMNVESQFLTHAWQGALGYTSVSLGNAHLKGKLHFVE